MSLLQYLVATSARVRQIEREVSRIAEGLEAVCKRLQAASEPSAKSAAPVPGPG